MPSNIANGIRIIGVKNEKQPIEDDERVLVIRLWKKMLYKQDDILRIKKSEPQKTPEETS